MSAFFSIEEREKIIIKNRPLVYYLAKKIDNNMSEYEDLVSVGTIGLIKATMTFDMSKNVKFSTYAARCIQNEILMYLRKEKRHEINQISLYTPLAEDPDGKKLLLMDVLYSQDNFTDKESVDEVFCRLTNIILNCLEPRERIIMLYKLADTKQIDIAKETKLSQSYISRLENKTIKKVKSYMYENTPYKENLKITLEKDSYKIAFASKKLIRFNKVLTSLAEMNNFLDLKVVNENEKINLVFPAKSESFFFVAKMFQEMEKYFLTFVNN